MKMLVLILTKMNKQHVYWTSSQIEAFPARFQLFCFKVQMFLINRARTHIYYWVRGSVFDVDQFEALLESEIVKKVR